MKKMILAGTAALIFSCAMGFANAYAYHKEAAAKAKSALCECKNCKCDDCQCGSCSAGDCACDEACSAANGCGGDDCCSK